MRLKRICCVIAAVLMLGTSLTGLAETQADVNNAVFELSSLGIFTGDEDGSLNLNPNSLTVIKEAYVEPELEKYDKEDSFQFMRTGYFCLDSKDSTKEHMVFNRIVSLKSSYKPN